MTYRDLDDDGNSSRYHSGRECIEHGCDKPAGTAWSPYWCVAHNIERIDRIDANLKAFRRGFAGLPKETDQ